MLTPHTGPSVGSSWFLRKTKGLCSNAVITAALVANKVHFPHFT